MKNVAIALILISVVLTLIFRGNSYLVERYYSYFEQGIFYYAVAWNAFYALIVGFLSFKFICHYSKYYPWIFVIVPFINVFFLGVLIGDIDENIKNLLGGFGLMMFFTSVQGVFIVLGGLWGMSFYGRRRA